MAPGKHCALDQGGQSMCPFLAAALCAFAQLLAVQLLAQATLLA